MRTNVFMGFCYTHTSRTYGNRFLYIIVLCRVYVLIIKLYILNVCKRILFVNVNYSVTYSNKKNNEFEG